jgi:hypothetical protein
MQSKLNLVPITFKGQKLIDISEEVKSLRFFSSHCRLNSAICANVEFIDFARKIESIKSNIGTLLAQTIDKNVKGEVTINENDSIITYDFQIERDNRSLKPQRIIFIPRAIDYKQPLKPTLCFTSFNTELVKGKNVLVEKIFTPKQKEIDYYTNLGPSWILRDYVEKTQHSFKHLLFTNFFNRSPYYFICESQTYDEFYFPTFPYRIMRRQAFLFREFLNENGKIIKESKLNCKSYNEITRQDIDEALLENSSINSFFEPTR